MYDETLLDINRMLIISVRFRTRRTRGAVEEPPEGELEEGVDGLIAIVDPLHFAVIGLAGS